MSAVMDPDAFKAVGYAIWGASSLLLSIALATIVRHSARLRIVNGFGLMALAALLHALKEVADIYHSTHPIHPDYLEPWFVGISAALRLVSWTLMFQGALTTMLVSAERAYLRFAPWVLLALMQLGLIVTGQSTPQDAKLTGIFVLGIPAFLAASAAMATFGWKLRPLGYLLPRIGAYGAAAGFLLLAIVISVRVRTIGEVPMHAIRAACSLVSSTSVTLMMIGFWTPRRT